MIKNVSVHLTITVQKTIDGVEGGHHRAHSKSGAILNTVFENKVRLVNICVETGGGHFEHYL